MENIRMITEKQLSLLRSLIADERSCLSSFSGYTDEQLSTLTIGAASHIISEAINFIRGIQYYTECDCYELDATDAAYAAILNMGYPYVPKCSKRAIAYHQGKMKLGLWQNGREDYEFTFKFDGYDLIVTIVNGNLKNIKNSVTGELF